MIKLQVSGFATVATEGEMDGIIFFCKMQVLLLETQLQVASKATRPLWEQMALQVHLAPISSMWIPERFASFGYTLNPSTAMNETTVPAVALSSHPALRPETSIFTASVR